MVTFKTRFCVLVALVATILAAVPATGYGQGTRRHRRSVEVIRLPLVAIPSPDAGAPQVAAAPLNALPAQHQEDRPAPSDAAASAGASTSGQALLEACFTQCIGSNASQRVAVCGRSPDVAANPSLCLNDVAIPACVQARRAIQTNAAELTSAFCGGMTAAANVARVAAQQAEARRRAAAESACAAETTSERWRQACLRCFLAGRGWITGDRGEQIVRNASGTEAPTDDQEVRFRCQTGSALPIYGAIERFRAGLAEVRTMHDTFRSSLATTGVPLDVSTARLLAAQARALNQLNARSDLNETQLAVDLCHMRQQAAGTLASEAATGSSSGGSPAPRVVPANVTVWLSQPFEPLIPDRRPAPSPAPSVTPSGEVNNCAEVEEQFARLQRNYAEQFATRQQRFLPRMEELVAVLDRIVAACSPDRLVDPINASACAQARAQLAGWVDAPMTPSSPEEAPQTTPPAPPAREPVTPTDDPPPR